LLVHGHVDDSGTHFALKYACELFSVIPVKNLRKNGRLVTRHELFTGRKPKINKFRVLFCPCVVKKHTYYKKNDRGENILSDVKPLSQRGFRGIFVGFDDLTSGYQIYVPNIRQIIVSNDVIFDEYFTSALVNQFQSYKEATKVRNLLENPPSNVNDKEKTGDITTTNLFPTSDPSHETTFSLDKGVNYEDDNYIETSSEPIYNIDNQISSANLDNNNGQDNIIDISDDNLSDNDNHDTMSDSESSKKTVRFETPEKRVTRSMSINSDQPRKSNRIANKLKRKISSNMAYMMKEVNKEVDWSVFGDPNNYLPEPTGPRQLLKLKKTDPTAYKAWQIGTRIEIKALLDHDTFYVEEPKNGEFVLPTTLKCKLKFTSEGKIDKFKIRICARGDIQKQVFFEDTWSAMCSKRGIRIFLAKAATTRSKVRQLDFLGAFLQAPVRSVVYVILDNIIADICPEYSEWCGVPLRLRRSIYGMTHSGKWWFLELLQWLISEAIGFSQSETDPTIFTRKEDDGSFTHFMVYVDDSLYFNSLTNADKYIKIFENELSGRFRVEFQGQAHWFLSMRLGRDASGNITIDQSRYALNIVNKYLGNHSTDKAINRPLPHDFVATKADCSTTDQEVGLLSQEYRLDYPSVIGSLIYLMNTRPDISFAVTKLAKFMRNPGRKHFQYVIHLLQYIKSNTRYGLRYYSDYKESPVHQFMKESEVPVNGHIFGMHDSSWQDCPDTGRSTGCYFNFISGGIVDFNTFVPSPVAMSSTEAEMNAGASAAMSMSFVRMLWNELNLTEVDMLWDPPIDMFCDNNGAVIFANSEKDSKAMRHTKRRMFYMRQCRREKELAYTFLDNKWMLADVGTKNVGVPSLSNVLNIILVPVPA